MKKRIKYIIDNSPFWQKWIQLGKRFTLPGFDKVPVFEVVKFLFAEMKKDKIPTRARSIAYSFFIAFFPGMIFLLTLLPFIPLSNFQVEFLKLLQEIVPQEVHRDLIELTLDDLLNKPRTGLLSLGAIFTLYFSTQGVVSMILSFNKTYSIYTHRNILLTRWVALKLTVLLFILFIISIGLIIVGGNFIGHLMEFLHIKSSLIVFALNALRYIIIVLLFFLSISTIYYYGPAVKNKFRFISPGSTFATIVSILASIIFSAYVGGIDRYNTVYGIFGTIIIFLTWMYINAFVLLIGFELNASIYYKREENDREKSLRADFLAEESAEI